MCPDGSCSFTRPSFSVFDSLEGSWSHVVTLPLVARDSVEGVTTARMAARKPWSIFSAISWTRAMKYLRSTQRGSERVSLLLYSPGQYYYLLKKDIPCFKTINNAILKKKRSLKNEGMSMMESRVNLIELLERNIPSSDCYSLKLGDTAVLVEPGDDGHVDERLRL